MKTITKIITLFAIATLAGCAAFHRMEGDYHYNQLSYHGAIKPYQKSLKRKYNQSVALNLADSYRQNSQPGMALPLYRKALSVGGVKADEYLRYTDVLFKTGNAHEARPWLERYVDIHPHDSQAQAYLLALDSLTVFREDTGYFKLNRLGTEFNTGGSNFSPAYYKNGIVFAAERKHNWFTGDAEWTGRDYLDLYYVEKRADGKWASATPLSGNINSLYHEGPLAFSNDGKKVYFTRNNYLRGKQGKSDGYVNNLKMYMARIDEHGKWTDIKELDMNSDEFSVGHPALSPDGLKLYFVSDMPGGLGGTDIYVCESKGADLWGKPVNLGSVVNTRGDEMFPYFNSDGTLFFSSDGHPGLGGLDIFQTHQQSPTWSTPRNLRHPVNSPVDDFGLIADADFREGFLSSNRGSNEGLDRIYAFKREDAEVDLEGLVVNKMTGKPISGAMVSMDVNNVKTTVFKSDGQGGFYTTLELDKAYAFHGSKEGYFAGDAEMDTKGQRKHKTYRVVIELDTLIVGQPIVLKDIYYDFDKWNIRPDAEPDLNHLVHVMTDNPLIRVELSSHTDSRGSDKYNANLSQKRAQSAVDFIISKGISKDRIVAKGYGESRLVNGCNNKAKCTEEEHQANRRTEFKVISIDSPKVDGDGYWID
jgi:outer membrane protein OmpA-like peptidoglycan-associated protein/tetratricopeptide (TPR) repeat protein